MKTPVMMRVIAYSAFAVLLTGCASKPAPAPAAKVAQAIPAESKFSKISVGMSMKQVFDTIGQPTDTRSYTTGKAFIPFYFGSDVARSEALYKGEGRIVFTGAGIGGTGFRVYTITYDPTEDGYNNK